MQAQSHSIASLHPTHSTLTCSTHALASALHAFTSALSQHSRADCPRESLKALETTTVASDVLPDDVGTL